MNAGLCVRQKVINLACVDLTPEVCTAVFGWRSVRGRQAVVHVLAVDDTSTLAREVHGRKVSGACTVLKVTNKKKDFKMDEKLYDNPICGHNQEFFWGGHFLRFFRDEDPIKKS